MLSSTNGPKSFFSEGFACRPVEIFLNEAGSDHQSKRALSYIFGAAEECDVEHSPSDISETNIRNMGRGANKDFSRRVVYSSPASEDSHAEISEHGFSILEVLCAFVILSFCSLIVIRGTETGISQLRSAKLYSLLAEQTTQNNLDMTALAPSRVPQLVSSNSDWVVFPSVSSDGKLTQRSILVRRKAER